nr:D-alanyl-D-alanine carboxypeptidase family protein [Jiella mangrovi]
MPAGPAAAKAPPASQAVVPTPKPSVEAAASNDEDSADDGESASEAADPASAGTPAPAADAPAAEEPRYTMASIVVDFATGKVLSQKDATQHRYPASTTKLMTAYLALKALGENRVALDSPVIVTRTAASQAPSKMGYPPGSVIRLDNALKMMLVKSANDIAVAIGQSLAGGSEEGFVAMMNAEARRLGMHDTHFINPNGLPGDGQYSSARDLALLAIHIRREFPAFTGYFDIEAISNGRSLMRNGNKLLGRFDGANGMKTGYICASGFNLVSSATRNGRTLVAVVLGANGTIERERLSAAILEAGFETDPAIKTQTIEDLPSTPSQVVDLSDYICSREGRTARANDRLEERNRDQFYGSPYLTEMKRPPVTVKVGLGGAAGNDVVAAGISVIENYGIPIPTPRPTPEPPVASAAAEEDTPQPGTDAAPAEESELPGSGARQPDKTPAAVNAYSGGQESRLRFPLGVQSPMAIRGPRLDIGAHRDLRPTAFGNQRDAPDQGAD